MYENLENLIIKILTLFLLLSILINIGFYVTIKDQSKIIKQSIQVIKELSSELNNYYQNNRERIMTIREIARFTSIRNKIKPKSNKHHYKTWDKVFFYLFSDLYNNQEN